MRKTKRLLAAVLLLLLLSACSGEGAHEQTQDELAAECLALARSYSELERGDTQALLDLFDSDGKCAVDAQGLLQMSHAELIEDYIAGGGTDLDDSLEVYALNSDGGFTRYELEGGSVSIIRASWQGELPVITQQEQYALSGARLTEKGSFIFSFDIPGNPASKYAHDGYIVPCIRLRTTAADPKCAELCEKYAKPLGYARCRLLSQDWEAGNMSGADIAGTFDRLFYLDTGLRIWDDASGVSVEEFTGEVHIPAQMLIGLLTRYLPFTEAELKGRAEYDAGTDEFRFCIDTDQAAFDTPQPEPEVVGFSENADGTLTLTVDEVFLDEGSDCLLRSELTVRPNGDGSFSYVSNRF